MSWSYSGDPSKSALDEVRFLTGDTDPKEIILSDEEIAFLISSEPNTLEAGIRACEVIAAKYSRLADERVGEVSISYKQKAENYLKLSETLKERRTEADIKTAKVNAIPFSGSISDPIFTRNM